MMSDPVLTQDEVDTLLDDEQHNQMVATASREVVRFDFEEQYDLRLSRLPRLQKINEVLTKGMSTSFSRFFSREFEVSIGYMQTQRFSDYIRGLRDQHNISVIQIMPQQANGLVIIDPQLLYGLVDQYFGGTGRMTGLDQEKTLSATEKRLSLQIVELVLGEFQAAWKTVAAFTFSSLRTEDVSGANQIMNFSDIAVVFSLQIPLGDASGSIQVVLPYSWLETIRPLLSTENKKEAVEDKRWQNALAKELASVNVDVSCSITGPSMTLSEILRLKAGDVVPVLRPSQVILHIEELPVFEGTLGTSQGKNAVKITTLLDAAEAKS